MLRPGPVRFDSPSWRLVSFLFLLASAGLAGPERLLAAENTLPRLVKFQGQLPLADAASLPQPVSITFSLYESQSDESPEWLETQLVVLDAEGGFTVSLGADSAEGLPLELFAGNSSRWLAYGLSDSAASEHTRVLLMSVPYALKAGDADTLGGHPASAFVLNAAALTARVDEAGGVAALTDVLPSAAISGSGTTNAITRWSDGPNGVVADSILSENSGKVGLSNPNPVVALDISGTIRAVSGPTAPFGTYLMPTGGPGNGFRFGFGSNLYFDGTNWRTRGDGANNAGSALLTDIGLGHMQIFTLPPTGGADQVVSNASFAAFEKFRISANGNVGIGTTASAEKLQVAGNVKITGTGNGVVFPDATTLASANPARIRGISFVAGCDWCGVLADVYDNKAIYFNVIGAMTINSVTCFSDMGTPTINIQRDDGSPANILSAALQCSTAGTTTTSIVGGESTLNLNDKLDFVMVSAGGVAHRATVVIKTTVN